MKPLYKRILLWGLLILHISLIFSFSFQNAAESSVLSKEVTAKIKSAEKIEEDLRNKVEMNDEGKYSVVANGKFIKIEGVIRKSAHISLFFVLEIILIFLIMSYGAGRLFAASVSILFAAAVGFADETIQLFSVGRAGMITDVFIDLTGAIIASILFVAGGKLNERIKEKRLKMDS